MALYAHGVHYNPLTRERTPLPDGVSKMHGLLIHAPLTGGCDVYTLVERGRIPPSERVGLVEPVAIALPLQQQPVELHAVVPPDGEVREWECDRYRLDKPNPFRWRDSAALYKAHKMAVAQLPDERYFEYFARVLGMRRRGLYFSLKHVLETEKLGISVENVDVAPVVVVDPSLGVPQAVADEVVRLGAHRAAFDVLVTHALIQKMQADPSYRNLCL
jgi:hypothetical protein